MVEDLKLERNDQVTFYETKDSTGDTYAQIHVTKHRPGLVTPMAQVTAPAPAIDTAQGANTSAAHAAAAAAGASPSGMAPAGKRRTFRTKEQSQRRQVENPAQNHHVAATAAVNNPVPVETAPVNAPVPPPIAPTAAAAPTATAGPSSKRKFEECPWFQNFDSVMKILKRHSVSKPTIKEFNQQFLNFSPEVSGTVYASLALVDEDGDNEQVQEWADQWAKMFKENKEG